MARPINDDPPGDPDPPPDTPGQLPGLAAYSRKRYTSNLVVNEEVGVLDLLYDAVFPTSRMFMSQGANGKVRLQNKKPVDFALGRAEFTSGNTSISVDDISPWVADLSHSLLIGAHTNKSEVRTVTDANYSTAQNSVTLTTSAPANLVITGFSGCDGASTPATATVRVASFVAATDYTVALDGFDINFRPSVSDTTESIASFLAASFRGDPATNRRFRIDWVSGDTVTITGLFGSLVLNAALTNTHPSPQTDPVTAPTLSAVSGSLAAGEHRVAYAFKNLQGQTLLSPYKAITLSASQDIVVGNIVPPAGCTVAWYVSCESASVRLRFYLENDGSGFTISSLPLLTDPLPPDLNRTGAEVMRIMAVFSDRGEVRANLTSSNVIRATFKWSLGNREKSINRIDLKWRDAGQDWRLIEQRFNDNANIAKIKKVNKYEINGQGIDNYFQAYRIGAGELAERRDADFFYTWTATRVALLLEEGDVCAITDDGSGVINFPVRIESIELNTSGASLPKVTFTARKYSNTLYDDSVVERTIPVVTERHNPITWEGMYVTYGGNIVTDGK